MKPESLPNKSGVYIMKDSSGSVIYIGKAKDLRKRVSSYFSDSSKSYKINILLNRIREIDYIVAASEREALLIEDKLIKKFQPFYNTLLKDDKSYPFIGLTLSEKYPKLVKARNPSGHDISKDEFYGPYPLAGGLKSLMLWLTKTFNIRPCGYVLEREKRNYNNCIYFQAGKCSAPCLNKISRSNYMKNVKALKTLLQGKYKKLEKQLLKEMRRLSAKLQFEKAGKLRDAMLSIRQLNTKIRFQQIRHEDIEMMATTTEKLKSLKEKLGLMNFPATIECFDASNIGAVYSVGGSVRFHLAKSDKSNYRKYKIKHVEGQDDCAMIKEVVGRRLKRLLEESPGKIPDLILIDGGRGQLNSAFAVLKRYGLDKKIDIISLAKSHECEEVHTTKMGSPLKLEIFNEGFKLLQKIRDEAHRFAISYHRHIRKQIFK